MSFDFKRLTGSLLGMEALRRISVQNAIRDSKVFFGQPPILDYLVEHGQCTQAEIAAALGVSPASVAVSVKRMHKSGLIEKIGDENDLRCNKITITDFGRSELEKVHASFDKIDKAAYDGFSETELKEFEAYVERINKNLSKDLPDNKEVFMILNSDYSKEGGRS
jgi:DNA-binding MarR family transcriptional regulator